jgi:plasmid stabilization system protein ParE
VSSPFRFKPSADRDVESAFVWYEERRPGLGDEFLDEVGAAVTRIAENSRAHQIIRGRIRRAVVHRFPYLIFYVIDPQEIVVLACMHASRDPESWPVAGT